MQLSLIASRHGRREFVTRSVTPKVAVLNARSLSLLILLGERAGARTQDPVIKSHVLYRLSYALAQRRCVGGGWVRVNSVRRLRQGERASVPASYDTTCVDTRGARRSKNGPVAIRTFRRASSAGPRPRADLSGSAEPRWILVDAELAIVHVNALRQMGNLVSTGHGVEFGVRK